MEIEQLLREQIEAIVKLTDTEFQFVIDHFEVKYFRKTSMRYRQV